MSAFHNNRDAEELALYWHRIGLWLGVAIVVSGLGQWAWHAFAIREHKKHIETLENR